MLDQPILLTLKIQRYSTVKGDRNSKSIHYKLIIDDRPNSRLMINSNTHQQHMFSIYEIGSLYQSKHNHKVMYIEKRVFLRFDDHLGKSLYALKQRELTLRLKSKARETKTKSRKVFNTKHISKREVNVLQVPFKFDYSSGSPDCVRFLQNYGSSSEEDFVLSEWKELVLSKWSYQVYWHIFLAAMFWLFAIATTMCMVFFPNKTIFKLLSTSFIFFFFCYEILQFVAYCSFDARRYPFVFHSVIIL